MEFLLGVPVSCIVRFSFSRRNEFTVLAIPCRPIGSYSSCPFRKAARCGILLLRLLLLSNLWIYVRSASNTLAGLFCCLKAGNGSK